MNDLQLILPSVVQASQWFHITASFQPIAAGGDQHPRIYVNGRLVGTSGPTADRYGADNGDVLIGAGLRLLEYSRPLDGVMDEFYLFRGALTER